MTSLVDGGSESGQDGGLVADETRRLTIEIRARGRVVIQETGAACSFGDTCVFDLARGRRLTVLAEGTSERPFLAWTGACSGSGPCEVEMTEDRAVGADFLHVPDSYTRRLTVSVGGEGRVLGWSTAPAIDCPGECSAMFSGVAILEAHPRQGWTIGHWDGPCSIRDGHCWIDVESDASVTAVFEELPPLPSPPPVCAELMPPPLDDGIEVAVEGWCRPETKTIGGRHSMSDGSGVFALALDGWGYPYGRFVTLDGVDARTIGYFAGASYRLIPQPSGFLEILFTEMGRYSLFHHDGDGVERLVEQFDCGDFNDCSPRAHVVTAEDPEGGLGAIRHLYDAPPVDGRRPIEFRRYAADGTPETDWVQLQDARAAFRMGYASGRRVLVVAASRTGDSSTFAGQWLDARGRSLTPWFAIDGEVVGATLPPSSPLTLLGSEVLVPTTTGLFVVSAGETDVRPAPAWLAARKDALFTSIRGGRAQALMNSPWCNGSIEVVTAGGESCGCLEGARLPRLDSNGPWVGRDGSLIDLGGDRSGTHCVYHLFPRALQ